MDVIYRRGRATAAESITSPSDYRCVVRTVIR